MSEISDPFWVPNVPYHIENWSLIPVNQAHTLTCFLRSIITALLLICQFIGFTPMDISVKILFAFLTSTLLDTCLSRLFLLHLITILVGDDYKFTNYGTRHNAICTNNPPLNLVMNISLRTPFSDPLSLT
jgi:hypothetical protein